MTARILSFRRLAPPVPEPHDPLLAKARAAMEKLREMQAARRPTLVAMRTTKSAPSTKDGRA